MHDRLGLGRVLHRLSNLRETGVPHLLLSTVMVQGSIYLIQLLVAHLLPADDFGYVKLLDSIILLLYIPASVGMPTALVRFVADRSYERDRPQILTEGLLLALGVSVGVTILSLVLASRLTTDSVVVGYIHELILVLPFMSVNRTLIAHYQGKSAIRRMALYNSVSGAITLLLVVLLTHLFGIQGWIWGRVASEMIFTAYLFILSRHEISYHIALRYARSLLSFGVYACLSLGVDRVMTSADAVLLAYFLHDPRAIANYGVATLFYFALQILPTTANAAYFPRIANLAYDPAHALRLAVRVAIVSQLVMVPVYAASFLLVRPLVIALFGSDYSAVPALFHVLLVGAIIVSVLNTLGTYLFSMGRSGYTLIGNTIGTMAALAMHGLLIPRYGATGAVVALVSANMLRLCIYGGVVFHLLYPRRLAELTIHAIRRSALSALAFGRVPLSFKQAAVIVAVAAILSWSVTLVANALTASVAPAFLPAVILTIACAVCCLAPIGHRFIRKRFDLMEPSIAFAIFVFFGYVIPSVQVMQGQDLTWSTWQFRAQDSLAHALPVALMSTLIAILSFYVGYASPVGKAVAKILPMPSRMISARRLCAVTLAYAGLGILLFVGLVAVLGGPSHLVSGLADRVRVLSGLNYFAIGPLVGAIGMLFVFVHSVSLGCPRNSPRVFIPLLVGFLFTLLLDQKTNVFSYLLAVAVIWHYIRRRISISQASIGVIVSVLLFVGFDLLFREYLIRGYIVLDPYGKQASAIQAIWWRFSSDTFIQLQTLLLLVGAIPSNIHYFYGTTLMALFASPIPRALFPGKPISPAGVFSAIFFPNYYAAGTTIPPSIVGEYYMNFGVIGIAVGMVLFGVFFKVSYEYLNLGRGNPWVVLLYAFTYSNMFSWIRGESFAPTINYIVYMVLSLVVFIVSSGGRVAVRRRVPGVPTLASPAATK